MMKCKFLKVLSISTVLFLCLQSKITAQDVVDTSNFFVIRQKLLEQIQSENSSEEEEDGKLARFHRWEWLWRNRLGANGNMNTAKLTMINYLNNSQGRSAKLCDSPYDDNINWTNLGPFNSKGAFDSGGCKSVADKQNQGRVECISVNPRNSNEIVIGTWNSGAWLTTDGGDTWVNTTDDEGLSFFGVRSMVRHPLDPNIIYATTGTEGNLWDGDRYLYGVGIIMSTDGGFSWVRKSTANPYDTELNCHKIAIDPTSDLQNTTLFFTTIFSVERWEGDAQLTTITKQKMHEEYHYGFGQLWFGNHYMRDIVVADNGTAFFSNYFGLYSIPKGSTSSMATQVNIPLPIAYQAANLLVCPLAAKKEELRQDISIKINQQGHIVLIAHFEKFSSVSSTTCLKNGGDTFVYKSIDNGTTWTSKNCGLTPRIPGAQFDVEHDNSDIIYMEDDGRCMYKSTDGGKTFSSMNSGENHSDVRCVTTFGNNTENSMIFIATDGGISKTTNGMDWKDITGEGLSITNFYGIGITETNDKMIFAGAQDGNINYYNNGKWYETDPYADNGDCLITGTNNNIIYQEEQFDINVGTLKGNNVSNISYRSAGNWMSPLLLNPTNSNEFFIGTHFLQYGSVPTVTLISDAYDIKAHPKTNDFNVSSVAMSRNNGNVVYYSLYNSEDLKVFKASRKGTSWTITNITTNLSVVRENVTDITADPNNENRLWVTFGGFSSSNKVFKTENGGTTWENVSNCLPNFPALSIVYQEGSNDRLYVGTDIGVFYRDNVQTDWAKYGNGGPPCMVSDMEINNCASKLVVATYGRGLWEAPLLTDVPTEITVGTTTWNKNRTIASDIRVKKGATLKIEGTTTIPTIIGFGRGVRIIVEDGARLEVTNATLTNSCDYMWQGIEAWGNSSLQQTANNQSVIKLTNATIEYANNAITTWKVGDLATTGAIINAVDCKFINNTRSVEFMKYRNQSGGGTMSNIGRFINCKFTINTGYRRGNDFKYHISEWGVDGIVFLGCSFKCERSFPFDQELNAAIRTLDASVIIDADCGYKIPCANTGRSLFSGFNKAIHSTISKGLSFVRVDRSDFKDNAIGIHSEGATTILARGNNFKVGKQGITVSPDDIHEGIISMSTNGLLITESIFSPTFTTAAAPVTVGIRVRENGGNDNTLYRNTFRKETSNNSNKFYGNLANGANRNTAGMGLKYICNTHQNNILNGFDIAITDIGISLNQGDANSSAANKFSLGTVSGGAPAGSDFKNSSINNINYYYVNNPSIENPINIAGLTKILATNSNGCPIIYNPDYESDAFTTNNNYSPYSKNNIIVGTFLLNKDSLNLNKIRNWLESEENIENSMTIVETYLHVDDADKAEEVLNATIEKFNLDADSEREFDYFVTLKKMQIEWIRTNTSIFSIPQTEIDVLKHIAENSMARAGDGARGLLNFIYQTQYFIPPILPAENRKNSAEIGKIDISTPPNRTDVTLIAYPNPASQIVNFEYHTTNRTLNGASELVIKNQLGQTVKRFTMSSDGLISWNIENLALGVYYFILENEGNIIIPAQQLVITK